MPAPLARRVAMGVSPVHTVSWMSAPLRAYSPIRCPSSSYIKKVVAAVPVCPERRRVVPPLTGNP